MSRHSELSPEQLVAELVSSPDDAREIDDPADVEPARWHGAGADLDPRDTGGGAPGGRGRDRGTSPV